jgi:two-component system nitrogen regulation response regulator GlnG
MSRILIVDDEHAIGWSLRELLSDDGHAVEIAADIETALDACARLHPDAILLDVRLGTRDGLAALPDLRKVAGDVPVVVMTAFGDLDTAVRAVQAGAVDYLLKPFDLEKVSHVVARVLADRAAPAAASEPTAPPPPGQIVGSSPPMQEVFKQIALVAPTDLPVLITGDTGTGKELAARAIHAHGPRRGGPFVATNLAALAPGVVESELFGHVRGAFTGAAADRPGLFDMAAGGTLLLDEIGEAPADVQAKLLRVLETHEVTPVGAAAGHTVNVRVIAATNRDLTAACAAGSFRADLHHRLRGFPIAMPPLAGRTSDIEPLARHFLAAFVARHGGTPRGELVSPEFLDAVVTRQWPGNVRELKHAVEYAAVQARGGVLRPEHLPARAADAGPPNGAPLDVATVAVASAVKAWSAAARLAFGDLPEPDLHRRAVDLLDTTLLSETLAHCGGNRTAAAKLLGLDRATLRTRLKLLGLDE